jgi:hypothetical protein
MAGYHRRSTPMLGSLFTFTVAALFSAITVCTFAVNNFDRTFGDRTTGNPGWLMSIDYSFAQHPMKPFTDLSTFAVIVPADHIGGGDSPAISDVAYESARQPGQTWRVATEVPYRHIDPGRRLSM